MPTHSQNIAQFAIDVAVANDRIFKRTAVRFAEDTQIPISAGGRMPIDTGALQDSITIGTLGGISTGSALYAQTILSSPKNSPITVSYSVPYAVPVEFGNRGTPPRSFMRGAILKFPAFLAEETARRN